MGCAPPGAARRAGGARVAAAARRRLRPRALVLGAVCRPLRGSAPRMHHAPVSARRLALFGVGAGLLCIAFILLYTRFPQVPERRYIFDYLLRTQDVPGAAMVIFIAVAAAFAPLPRAGLALVEAIGRRPWTTARVTFLVLCAAQAAGCALLLTLASPAFSGMALGYFSMTAPLFFNLLYVWALLERRLFLAGIVGSFALVLHNPWPHFLFALPWIGWIAWHDGRRALLRLAAGYAPLTLLIGGGWWLLMRKVQGQLWFAPQTGDFLFYWQLQLSRVFAFPDAATLAKRAAELVKLWLWTVPGLPALMLAGWWLARRQAPLRLLGLSFAATLAGYLIVWFDQGYGWGVRYPHPAFAAAPVLGAAAIAAFNNEALRRYAAAAALLSLVIATPFRWAQIESFMSDHLSRRPPFEKGVRQVVFVTLDFPYYTQDFIQNDPFLRDPVIFTLSRGRAEDEKLLRSRFPGAHLSHVAPYGHVWRLD